MQEHHEFLLPSLAAGLFVDPDPSPVLANYGLDSLRVIEPTQPGQSIKGQAHRKKVATQQALERWLDEANIHNSSRDLRKPGVVKRKVLHVRHSRAQGYDVSLKGNSMMNK
jgi:acyl dehydratase